MAGSMIASRVSEAWAKAGAGWRGAAADGYYREYILQLQENAEQFDASCAALEEATRALASGLAALERRIDE